MNLSIITPPASEPVTLAEAKSFLRVDGADDDTLISNLITAARQLAERYTNRAFITQVWELVEDHAPDGPLYTPKPPLVSVDAVKVTAENGTETTVPASSYWVDKSIGRLVRANGYTWPTHRGFASFIIRFTAGYGASGSAVPAPIRQALLMTIANLYENRTDVVTGTIATELPTNSKTLLDPYRIRRI